MSGRRGRYDREDSAGGGIAKFARWAIAMKSRRFVVLGALKSEACAVVLVTLMLTCHLPAQEHVVSVEAPAAAKLKRPQPLMIRTVYEVKERIKQAGGGQDLAVCDITFEFRNTLPIPIRIAFPPVGVFFGGEVPFAKADDASLPKFARVNKIVELGPNKTQAYTSTGHAVAGLPGQYEWVFGRPSDVRLPENLFVGSVYSVPEPKRVQGGEQGGAADSQRPAR